MSEMVRVCRRGGRVVVCDVYTTTPEQAAEIWKALENFKETYPQLIPARRENECILLWLKDRNMHVTFSNLVESFEANALEGRLYLNPNAISAGSETEVSGQQLLQPRPERGIADLREPFQLGQQAADRGEDRGPLVALQAGRRLKLGGR